MIPRTKAATIVIATIQRLNDYHPIVARGLASVALVGCAALVAGFGTYGMFTSATSADHQAASGTVALNVGAAGTVDNRFNVDATDIAPGDTIQRALTLSNSGSIDLSALRLDTVASVSSLLDTGNNGLQLELDSCSQPWTESGTAPAFTYSCGGTTGSPFLTSPVIQSGVAMIGLASMSAGGTDYLRMRLTLPAAADNTYQGQMSRITFTFTGTQRAATDK